MEKIYTCQEVAVMYKVTKWTVWEWVRTGKLGSVKINGRYRIRQEDLAEFNNKNLKTI